MVKILVIESQSSEQNSSISHLCFDAASKIINEHGKISIDKVSLRNIFEIPFAISLNIELDDYDGLILLGCIEDKTDIKSQILYKEILRCSLDLSIHYALPIGFGIVLVAKDDENIKNIAINAAIESAISCVELLKLKSQLGFSQNDQFTRYSN